MLVLFFNEYQSFSISITIYEYQSVMDNKLTAILIMSAE